MRFLRRVLAVLLVLQTHALHADEWSLEHLMQQLAARKTGEASFEEKKYLALLSRPVISSGTLFFQAPDQLEKRTLTPRHESLLLIGDLLTIESGARRQVLELSNFPEVAVFVGGLRATLMGDGAALEKIYRIELAGTQQQWTLTLSPHNPRMAQSVSRIVISGRAALLSRVDIQQPDGDHSEMIITERPTSSAAVIPAATQP